MAMCPDGGVLLLGSSVYRKRGYMYRKYRHLFGNDDAEDLCWFAPSATMNPRLPVSVVEKALAEDAPRARAEYLSIYREDLDDFIPADVVDACTDFGIHERPPRRGINYVAHCDNAGGTGSDSMTLCNAHVEASYMIDAVRERKPRFVPAAVVAEWAPLLADACPQAPAAALGTA